jgi:hypothetical protein
MAGERLNNPSPRDGDAAVALEGIRPRRIAGKICGGAGLAGAVVVAHVRGWATAPDRQRQRERQMKTMKLIRIASLGLIMTAASSFARAAGAPEQEAIQCLRAIQAAAEKLDVDAIFGFVMENDKGALAQNGGVLVTREAALESTREGFRGVREIKYTTGQEHVTVLAEDLVLVVSDGRSRFQLDDGRFIETPFAQTVLLKRVAGMWKVLHAHRSFPAKI